MSSAVSFPPETYYHPAAQGDRSRHVAAVACVLGPRSCTFAGFDENGRLTAFEKHLAAPGRGDWNSAFLQAQFADGHFLEGGPGLSSVFLCDARQLVIPEALYSEETVSDWMRTLYFVAPDEDLVVTAVSGAPYRVATVCSAPLAGLVAAGKAGKGIYAMGAAVLHSVPCKEGVCARVLLTADTTYIALWREGALLEALAFSETDAQSIAYRLHGLLHKNEVDAAGVTLFTEYLYPAAETVALLGDYWPVVAPDEEALPSDGFPQAGVSRSFSRIRSCAS